MIHLALWIASTIFVVWFFWVCGVLVVHFIAATWRWLLVIVAVIALIVFSFTYTKPQKTPEQQSSAVDSPSTVAVGLTKEMDSYMRDSLQAGLKTAVAGSAPPIPQFSDNATKLAYQRWLGVMSERLNAKKSDRQVREEFLQTVWYESQRAGLDTALVLGFIQVTSDFKKYYVAQNGARGYMGVSPQWATKLSEGNAGKLFFLQTNLRFGCVIFRDYLNTRHGDVALGLGDYFQENLTGSGKQQTQREFVESVLAAKTSWELTAKSPAL